MRATRSLQRRTACRRWTPFRFDFRCVVRQRAACRSTKRRCRLHVQNELEDCKASLAAATRQKAMAEEHLEQAVVRVPVLPCRAAVAARPRGCSWDMRPVLLLVSQERERIAAMSLADARHMLERVQEEKVMSSLEAEQQLAVAEKERQVPFLAPALYTRVAPLPGAAARPARARTQ